MDEKVRKMLIIFVLILIFYWNRLWGIVGSLFFLVSYIDDKKNLKEDKLQLYEEMGILQEREDRESALFEKYRKT